MNYYHKNIRLLYAIALLQGMVFYGPIATLYRKAHGLTVFHITLIESLSLLLMILLEVPWGYAADKIGYKKTLVVCNFLFFLSKIVFWRANGFGLFLAERLMLSVVLSGISGCDSTVLYLSANRENTQKIFGIYNGMGTAGLIIASVIFSIVVKDNYALAAFLTIIPYAASAVLSLFLQEVKQIKEKARFADELKEILRFFCSKRHIFFLLVAAALLAEANQTITVFLSQLQYLRAGISIPAMGVLYIFVTLSGLLSTLSHRLSKRIGENKAGLIMFIGAGLACLMMAFCSNPLLSIAGIIILRVCSSLFVPFRLELMNRSITIPSRAAVLSLFSLIMNLVGICTNLTLGKLSDLGVKYAMAAGAVFCFAALLFYLLWAAATKKQILYSKTS